MDVNATTQLISSVGFPIALCVYMIYTMQKQSENHKSEINELSKTIENNTIAIVKLVEKIDRIEV